MSNFLKALILAVLSFSPAQYAVAAVDYNAFEYFDYLEKRQFQTLEATLKELQEGYEQGKYTDRVVAAAFYAFSNSDDRLEASLSEWVAQHPDSYAARLARGIYYVHLGFLARGARFADKTGESRFAGMQRWFEKAAEDLGRALSLNPRATVAYRHLMRISMAGGSPEATRKLFEQGVKEDPASYAVWNGYLFSLQPKWGGSMTGLGAAIRDMERKYDKNPELEVLSGYMQYSLGNEADVYEDNDKGALYYYDKALSKGGHYWFLLDRGRAYYRLGRYEKALEDFNGVLSIRPYYADAFRWRGRAHRMLGKNDAAMADYDTAIRLDRLDPDIRRDRGKLHRDLKQWDAALSDFSKALVYGDNKAYHWAYRGRVFKKKNEHKKALEDFQRAVDLDPEEEEYWYDMASAQYYLRDCGIVDTLNRYFELCEGGSCSEKRVEWGRKTLNHLESRNTCS